MMHLLRILFITLALCGFLTACQSVDTETEDEIMSMDDTSDSSAPEEQASGGDQSASDEEMEFDELDEATQDTAQNQNDTSEKLSEDDLGELEPATPTEPQAELQPEPQTQAQAEPTPEPSDLEPVAEDPQQELTAAPPIEEAASSGQEVQITDIKYLANQNGGSVVIEATGPINYQTRMNPDTNQFVIEIPGAILPEKLKRPYIMKEFKGAFGAINAYQQAGSRTARIVVQLKGSGASEPVVQAEGTSLVVIPSSENAVLAESKPEEDSGSSSGWEESINVEEAKKDEKLLGARTLDEFLTGQSKFYGRPISLQVKDADIRDVLNFVADESGLNMVISDDVQGKISLKLRRIPWDQALITVMRAKKLGYLRQNNVIRISTLDNLQQETDSARRIIESQKLLVPTKVRVIPVSYASVEELIKQLMPFLTKDRGSVVADARTSSLIVTDTDEVLERVARLVKELDVPPAQVMIEGKVVEAGEAFAQTVGVNWQYSGVPVNLSQSGGANGLPIDLSQNMAITTIDPKVAQGNPFAFNLSVGTLDVFGNISAALSLMERDSLVKVISSPRIVAMNKEKAKITQQGQQVTISGTKDSQGNITKAVQRDPIVLDLTVTPQITGDGSVIMDVEVKREFAGALLDTETNARAINSRTAKTKILVKNGQTAVIGGIYQSDNTESETGVPVLRNIPVLGWLFKSKTRDEVKNELIIFLTPKILNLKDQAVDLSS